MGSPCVRREQPYRELWQKVTEVSQPSLSHGNTPALCHNTSQTKSQHFCTPPVWAHIHVTQPYQRANPLHDCFPMKVQPSRFEEAFAPLFSINV